MSPPKKNKVIHREGREIISHVIEKCDEEAENNSFSHLAKQATRRAAFYTGVSETTIKLIRKENKRRNESDQNASLSTPGKKRAKKRQNTVSVDDFDQCVIRNVIHDFYVREKKVPTIANLLPVIKNKIDFPWGRKSLNRLLKQMGFKWRKCKSKRKVLIERAEIVTWRHDYLVQIRRFRESGREIVFIDESWVDSNLTFSKCWQHDKEFGVQANSSAGRRLIVVHAGSTNGFIPNAQLVYTAGSASGDYHGQMNHINFEKWVNEKLLPNLPEQSVIVMDNAPYHSMQVDKPPVKSSLKRDMLAWLQKKGVPCDESMHKCDLYKLVELKKSRQKTFKIDTELASHGHTVLRLPPYMCELNAVELAWAKIKRLVREKNTTGDLSLKMLTELTESAISSVTKQDWEGYCKHVEKEEEQYWKKDCILPDLVDSIIINLGGTSSDSDSDNDSDNSSTDSAVSADEFEEDLAQPL